MERNYISLVCKFKKASTDVEGKVDIQKGALGFRGRVDNRCVTFIHLTYMVIVLNDTR